MNRAAELGGGSGGRREISAARQARLHRRRNPIATDNDNRSLPCPIRLLLPSWDEYMCAGLEIVFATRDQIHDFSVLRNYNGFLAVLVFDLQSIPLDFLHLLRDRSIGHGAIRL